VIVFYRHAITETRGGEEMLLSPGERARADRFATATLRRRYVAAHAFLRRALARHTGAGAAGLRFGAGEFGKPLLVDFPRVHFNLSHSGDWAVCAVAEDGPIGVDIEEMRPLPDYDELAARVFSAEEMRRMAAASDSLRTFYDIWTKKEAVIKADGRGLAMPLPSFHVPEDASGVSRPDGRWAVRALDAPAGYAAATAFPARVRPAALHLQEFRT
jgi:4'-phosphopantetheinyl transferase